MTARGLQHAIAHGKDTDSMRTVMQAITQALRDLGLDLQGQGSDVAANEVVSKIGHTGRTRKAVQNGGSAHLTPDVMGAGNQSRSSHQGVRASLTLITSGGGRHWPLRAKRRCLSGRRLPSRDQASAWISVWGRRPSRMQ